MPGQWHTPQRSRRVVVRVTNNVYVRRIWVPHETRRSSAAGHEMQKTVRGGAYMYKRVRPPGSLLWLTPTCVLAGSQLISSSARGTLVHGSLKR